MTYVERMQEANARAHGIRRKLTESGNRGDVAMEAFAATGTVIQATDHVIGVGVLAEAGLPLADGVVWSDPDYVGNEPWDGDPRSLMEFMEAEQARRDPKSDGLTELQLMRECRVPIREATDAVTGAALSGGRCPDCQSTPGWSNNAICETCKGSGVVPMQEDTDDDALAGLRRTSTLEDLQEDSVDATDLDDDEDDLESASSLNSGRKQRRRKETARGANDPGRRNETEDREDAKSISNTGGASPYPSREAGFLMLRPPTEDDATQAMCEAGVMRRKAEPVPATTCRRYDDGEPIPAWLGA